jgi:hypothetical protein
MQSYYEATQAKIRAIKQNQILRRAINLDARSKIKPTLQNPSLLNMSHIRSSNK